MGSGVDSTQAQQVALSALALQAWAVRDRAHIYGDTKVGCAVQSRDGRMFVGCNVEHPFRCHDIHAEVNAIGTFAASGGDRIIAVVVVAETECFTPCGGCMDWIIEFAEAGCLVGFQSTMNGPITAWKVNELMPHYPRS